MVSQAARDTLLVVDDEQDTVELCGRIFRDTYRVLKATSAAEALDRAKGVDIAVALVDQRMPEKTGLDFFIELTQSHPHAGRVVMTGYTDLEDIVALINNGRVHGFVVKPWNNHQLRLTVDREVENYRKSKLIAQLNERLRKEHTDMLSLLHELDPQFSIPNSNDELKSTKNRLRQRVAGEVERLFLHQLLDGYDGNVAAAARSAKINRTFLYRLMRRHGLLEGEEDPQDEDAYAS